MKLKSEIQYRYHYFIHKTFDEVKKNLSNSEEKVAT